MWDRKALKRRARHALKKNYKAAIAVCFLLAMLAGMYGGSAVFIDAYDAGRATTEAVANNVETVKASQVVKDALQSFAAEHPESAGTQTLISAADLVIDWTMDGQGFFITILRIANGFVIEHGILVAWILLAGLVVRTIYSLYVTNILRVGGERFFLESRTYCGTQISRIFYLYRRRTVNNTALVMFLRDLYTTLWSFTIVGGMIKYYEYYMVPWLLAENPQMDRKTAFRLSKQMMHGNKWHTFVLGLSFLGWNILNVFTLGLLGIFFLHPYREAAAAELYAVLRKAALEQEFDGCEAMHDTYLFMMPEREPLAPQDECPTYPFALSPFRLQMPQALKPVNADRKYSVTSLILLFFIFSFVGWAWEVSLHLVQDGVFINRGTMFGPWLPIYGSGGILILLLLRRFMKKPMLTFFLAMAVCGTVEYGTSWYLEKTRGIKWWDYSGYFMNLNGRICLLGLVVFGIGGCAFLYYLAPRMDDLIEKIPKRVQIVLCIVLCALFGADAVYSAVHPNVGAGITDYPVTPEQSTAQPAAAAATIKSGAK